VWAIAAIVMTVSAGALGIAFYRAYRKVTKLSEENVLLEGALAGERDRRKKEWETHETRIKALQKAYDDIRQLLADNDPSVSEILAGIEGELSDHLDSFAPVLNLQIHGEDSD